MKICYFCTADAFVFQSFLSRDNKRATAYAGVFKQYRFEFILPNTHSPWSSPTQQQSSTFGLRSGSLKGKPRTFWWDSSDFHSSVESLSWIASNCKVAHLFFFLFLLLLLLYPTFILMRGSEAQLCARSPDQYVGWSEINRSCSIRIGKKKKTEQWVLTSTST